MHKKLIIALSLLAAVFVVAGCKSDKAEEKNDAKASTPTTLKGDKTIYGLVCEGCTDSVLVLLPSDDSDPVKYDIIDATQAHKVFGKLSIGDWVGIVVDPTDKKVATLVINLDQLKGTWCYQVQPQLRDYESMSKRLQKRMMRDMPDSVKQTYLIPREYGFTLKRQYSATPVGFVAMANSLEDESPVVYPEVPYYSEWHIWNGKLILSREANHVAGAQQSTAKQKLVNDTASFVMLTADSLVLDFGTHVQSYYSRANAQDANKKARAVATRQAKKAINSAIQTK